MKNKLSTWDYRVIEGVWERVEKKDNGGKWRGDWKSDALSFQFKTVWKNKYRP